MLSYFLVLAWLAGNPPPTELPCAAPLSWHAPIALCLYVVATFLLYQGAALLKWAIQGEDGAPNPQAGIMLAWVATAVIIIYYYTSLLISQPSLINGVITDKSSLAGFLVGLLALPFEAPDTFSQALLVASLPTGVLAAFKFLMAALLGRSTRVPASALTRSPLALLAAGLFTLLQLAGSIASLVALYR